MSPEEKSRAAIKDKSKADKEAEAILKRAEFQEKEPESAEPKQKEVVVEHSISMRLAAFALVMTVIFSACLYANTVPAVTCVYLWMAGMGVYLSYRYRVSRPMWVPFIPFIGAVFVIFYFVAVTVNQVLSHHVNFLTPFLQVLAGLLALHCFDLRTRDDFSISVLISRSVFSLTAGAASDYLFLFLVTVFILSLTFLLYFDSVSRSQEVGPSRPVGEGRPASLPKPIAIISPRAATVTILVPILCVPVVTMLVFYGIPRKDSIIDWLMRDLIGPHFAISSIDRNKGANPNALSAGNNPLGVGESSGPSGRGGSAAGGDSKGGAMTGDPKKSVSPIGRETDGEDVSGIGSGKPANDQAGEEDYEETVDEKPEQVDLLRKDLPANKIIFRIAAPRSGYSRRTTYDFYDGKTWKRNGPIDGVKFPKEKNAISVGNANALLVPADCPTVEVRQSFTVDVSSVGKYLPAYSIPQAVGGPFDKVTVQSDGTLKVSKPIGGGATYNVVSLLPVYKVHVMRNLPKRTHSHFKETILGPPVKEMEGKEKALIDKYLQLPEEMPDKVKVLAKKVAGNKGNWFVKAEKIANYLRKNCKFKAEMQERPEKGDFVYNFLYKTREGNCLEFASAFVVMARAAGIPARCVGGYLPGKLNKKTGFYEIRVRDGHAWGEIYLPDWSWVPFDATPVGYYPEVEVEENFLAKLADLGFSNPFGGVLQAPSPSLGAGLGEGIAGSDLDRSIKQEKLSKDDDAKGKLSEEQEDLNVLDKFKEFNWNIVAAVFILIGSLYVAFMIWRQKRRAEAPEIPENAKRSTLIYLEMINDLRRYQVIRLPSETPGEVEMRVRSAFELSRVEGREVPKELEPLIKQFLEVYHLDRFGRAERVDELESMSKQIRELVKSGSKAGS